MKTKFKGFIALTMSVLVAVGALTATVKVVLDDSNSDTVAADSVITVGSDTSNTTSDTVKNDVNDSIYRVSDTLRADTSVQDVNNLPEKTIDIGSGSGGGSGSKTVVPGFTKDADVTDLSKIKESLTTFIRGLANDEDYYVSDYELNLVCEVLSNNIGDLTVRRNYDDALAFVNTAIDDKDSSEYKELQDIYLNSRLQNESLALLSTNYYAKKFVAEAGSKYLSQYKTTDAQEIATKNAALYMAGGSQLGAAEKLSQMVTAVIQNTFGQDQILVLNNAVKQTAKQTEADIKEAETTAEANKTLLANATAVAALDEYFSREEFTTSSYSLPQLVRQFALISNSRDSRQANEQLAFILNASKSGEKKDLAIIDEFAKSMACNIGDVENDIANELAQIDMAESYAVGLDFLAWFYNTEPVNLYAEDINNLRSFLTEECDSIKEATQYLRDVRASASKDGKLFNEFTTAYKAFLQKENQSYDLERLASDYVYYYCFNKNVDTTTLNRSTGYFIEALERFMSEDEMYTALRSVEKDKRACDKLFRYWIYHTHYLEAVDEFLYWFNGYTPDKPDVTLTASVAAANAQMMTPELAMANYKLDAANMVAGAQVQDKVLYSSLQMETSLMATKKKATKKSIRIRRSSMDMELIDQFIAWHLDLVNNGSINNALSELVYINDSDDDEWCDFADTYMDHLYTDPYDTEVKIFIKNYIDAFANNVDCLDTFVNTDLTLKAAEEDYFKEEKALDEIKEGIKEEKKEELEIEKIADKALVDEVQDLAPATFTDDDIAELTASFRSWYLDKCDDSVYWAYVYLAAANANDGWLDIANVFDAERDNDAYELASSAFIDTVIAEYGIDMTKADLYEALTAWLSANMPMKAAIVQLKRANDDYTNGDQMIWKKFADDFCAFLDIDVDDDIKTKLEEIVAKFAAKQELGGLVTKRFTSAVFELLGVDIQTFVEMATSDDGKKLEEVQSKLISMLDNFNKYNDNLDAFALYINENKDLKNKYAASDIETAMQLMLDSESYIACQDMLSKIMDIHSKDCTAFCDYLAGNDDIGTPKKKENDGKVDEAILKEFDKIVEEYAISNEVKEEDIQEFVTMMNLTIGDEYKEEFINDLISENPANVEKATTELDNTLAQLNAYNELVMAILGQLSVEEDIPNNYTVQEIKGVIATVSGSNSYSKYIDTANAILKSSNNEYNDFCAYLLANIDSIGTPRDALPIEAAEEFAELKEETQEEDDEDADLEEKVKEEVPVMKEEEVEHAVEPEPEPEVEPEPEPEPEPVPEEEYQYIPEPAGLPPVCDQQSIVEE